MSDTPETPEGAKPEKTKRKQQVYTLVVELGRSPGDGLPEGATGAALMCFASGVDEDEAVRETVAVLKVAELSPVDITGYGTLAEREALLAQLDAELAARRAELAEAKAANIAVPDGHDYNEADTRKHFIDVLLREAGWEIGRNAAIEVPFAVGTHDRPAGLTMSTQRRLLGPDVIVDRWSDAIVAFAWEALLETARRLAERAGKDTQGRPLIPVAIASGSGTLHIQPMARHNLRD